MDTEPNSDTHDEWEDTNQTKWEAESDPFDPTKLAAYAVSIVTGDGPVFIGRVVAPFPPSALFPGWIWRAPGGTPHGIADSRRQAILKMAIHAAITMPDKGRP